MVKLGNISSLKNIRDRHKPKTSSNHIGIELECYIRWDTDSVYEDDDLFATLSGAFWAAGVAENVQVKDDGSISGDGIGVEIAFIAPENNYKERLKVVLDILKKFGADVNSTCGMHVHLDMRNRNVSTCYNNLVLTQDLLFSLCPSRKGNTYCTPNSSSNWGSRDQRRCAINPLAYVRHKTLEVRIHSGCLDYKRIVDYVDTLIHIASLKRKLKKVSYINNLAAIEAIDLPIRLRKQFIPKKTKASVARAA